jgi:ABC-2 type transport system ATP-binding protein
MNEMAKPDISQGTLRPKAASIIRLERVEKKYGRQRVVFIDKLTLQEGDRLMIYGANGSGKSTLLRLLAGISKAQKGSVWHAKSLEEDILGFVPQSLGLYPELSLRNNLVIRKELYGLQGGKLEEDWYIREFGLAPFLDRRFGELSGGFQRLAVIAAALFSAPTWLLLDEPFAGVDSSKRLKVLHGMNSIVTEARILVISVPTRQDFPKINKWIGMEEGKIVCEEP